MASAATNSGILAAWATLGSISRACDASARSMRSRPCRTDGVRSCGDEGIDQRRTRPAASSPAPTMARAEPSKVLLALLFIRAVFSALLVEVWSRRRRFGREAGGRAGGGDLQLLGYLLERGSP